MNRKAVYGILLVLLLPLTGYFILKRASERAIILPRHFIFDTVTLQTRNGKEYIDTVWHRLPDFSMTNQMGRKVSWNDMDHKIVVANFFFTHCPTICPATTVNMK